MQAAFVTLLVNELTVSDLTALEEISLRNGLIALCLSLLMIPLWGFLVHVLVAGPAYELLAPCIIPDESRCKLTLLTFENTDWALVWQPVLRDCFDLSLEGMSEVVLTPIWLYQQGVSRSFFLSQIVFITSYGPSRTRDSKHVLPYVFLGCHTCPGAVYLVR